MNEQDMIDTETPPLWRRVWAWLHARRPKLRSREWWNGWGYGMISSGLIQLAILACLFLSGCTPPTSPDITTSCQSLHTTQDGTADSLWAVPCDLGRVE